MDTIVEEPKTETTTTDPDAGKSTFGHIVLEKKSQQTEAPVKEPPTKPEPTKEPPKEPPKEAPPATTPVGDVLDAALSQAPPTTEAPSASPVDEFANVTDGVKSETVKSRMIGMRGKIKALWEENQTLAREREEFASKVKPPLEDPEVQQLIKTRDEEIARANEALLALNIESHPDFIREFTQPREKLAKSAAQKLQAYAGNGQALIDALYMPEGIRRDEAIEQLTADIPDYAKSKISGIITQIETLDERAQEKRSDAPKTWQELSARDIEVRRKKAEDYRGQVNGIFVEITRKLSDTPFFRELGDDIQGASEWNKDRNAAFDRGLQHILGSDNTIQKSLETAIKGERFDTVQNMLVKERELRKAAERKLTEYEGVQPTLRGGSPPAGKEDDDEKNLGFGDIMARRAARRSANDE